jgi:hypothetical protein
MKLNQEVVDLTPEDHPERALHQGSLAVSLTARYHQARGGAGSARRKRMCCGSCCVSGWCLLEKECKSQCAWRTSVQWVGVGYPTGTGQAAGGILRKRMARDVCRDGHPKKEIPFYTDLLQKKKKKNSAPTYI